MRKIIQICSDVETDEVFGVLHALCNDGTLWFRTQKNGEGWTQIKGVPQPENRQPEAGV